MFDTTLRWLVLRIQWRGERGAGLTEYALLIALIALVTAAALGYFQDETATKLSEASSAVVNAG